MLKYHLNLMYYPAMLRSGIEGRNQSLLTWLRLEEHACVVATEVVWARMPGFAWWPAQKLLRSGIELIRSGGLSDTKTPPCTETQSIRVRFFGEENLEVIAAEEAMNRICEFTSRQKEVKGGMGKVSQRHRASDSSSVNLIYCDIFPTIHFTVHFLQLTFISSFRASVWRIHWRVWRWRSSKLPSELITSWVWMRCKVPED